MRLKFLPSFLLCVLSSALLVFSYPNFDFGPLIWIALVPWLFAIEGRKGSSAFGYSYLVGVIFFAGTLNWFLYVTVPGAILLCLVLALYFALFGWAYQFFARASLGVRCLALPSVWVAIEFARGHLFSGFGWICLAHSQHQNTTLIQIADITGVYGVSFLIVLFNLVVKENLALVFNAKAIPSKLLLRLNLIVLSLLVGIYSYGFWRLSHVAPMETLKVGLVQANIPQSDKWVLEERAEIILKFLDLSKEAVKAKPDLLIWPETAFPGFAAETPELMELIREFVRRSGVPLLMGIVTENSDLQFFNSAILISPQGDIAEQYDKLHLVPFGEYLPFRKFLPFLADAVGLEDFSPGKEATVFHQTIGTSQPQEIRYSVAICFEDTLAYIARRFVKEGAQLLVNITNDGWFHDSQEPFMHLQASLFRTVETKRSLVRCANTGISCGIDPYGRMVRFLQDQRGKKTYIEGVSVFPIPINKEVTIYTKIGDLFTYLCFVCILWAGYVRKVALK